MVKPVPAGPEATGGAGTTMEHRYGGALLAALVLHEPVAGLGGSLIPVGVAFQQDAAVDDFVVRAEGAEAFVTWYVAARRRPVLAASKAKTVSLFATFLRVVEGQLSGVEAGTVLLGLAVKGPYGPAEELDMLCKVAAAHGAGVTFRTAIGKRARRLRKRLQHVDDVVVAAATQLGWEAELTQSRDWTWTLLRTLRVVQTLLDDGQQDTVDLTSRLTSVVDGGVDAANECRRELQALSAELATAAGNVAEADVRRRLVGRVRLACPPDMAAARAVFEAQERALNVRTPRVLRASDSGGTVELAVDRTTAANELATALRGASETAGVLVVRGEPSVGKTVLVLDVVDRLRTEGAEVAVLSLRAPLDAGVPLPRVFGAFPVARHRLLVLDGAEAVQEGQRDHFQVVAAAALAAGLGVVAVTRDDAKDAVAAALGDIAGVSPKEKTVAPLPLNDIEVVTTKFPALARLRERRSQWLLQRLGLVDLLLRGGAETRLRDGTLSEADVFGAVWQGWVRRHGVHPPGSSSPDSRERALLDVARRHLALPVDASAAHVDAIPSLRSDGLLQPYSPLRPGEEFPNDVVRDFATVHLLLRDGDPIIAEAGAPRWTLRAARVACQAQLLNGGAQELRRQLDVFDALAATHGGRWADVPWEALLRSGLARELLEALTPLLVADTGRRLQELLHVAEQHFSDVAAADPVLVEPVIAWLADRDLEVPQQVARQVEEILVLWLRGVSRDEAAKDDETTRGVRRRLRAAVLAREPDGGDDHLLEALALLGGDLDDAVEVVLRTVATDCPWALLPVVEGADAARALARQDPILLTELAAAYYIDDSNHGARSGLLIDHGVRDHRFRGLGAPRAAWYYGPFWTLLETEPRRGVALISKLLLHAAQTRVGHEVDRAMGVTADLFELGERTYVGDTEVYTWYRGPAGSPAPCTSALLACERAMDQLAGVGPLRSVARTFLMNAYDLATVGLVVGFLVRHLDQVTDELDDFLTRPELWRLESHRAAFELGELHVQDDEHVYGQQLRQLSFRQVALLLGSRAARSADGADRARLRRIAERLLAAGASNLSEPPPELGMWASYFDPDNYTPVEGSSRARFVYEEPTEVTEALRAQRENIERTTEVYRLQNRYRLTLEPPFHTGSPSVDHDAIAADLSMARALAASPPGVSQDLVDSTVAATAGAAVRAVAAGGSVDEEDLLWAMGRVVGSLQPEPRDLFAYEGSLYAMGADRSAAAAVPALLMPAYIDGDDPLLDLDRLGVAVEALSAATTNPTHEVRRITALALREVWTAPCGPSGSQCRHQKAWAAVETGARDIAMGPWDDQGRRPSTALRGNLEEALRGASGQELLLPRLGAALASASHASSAARCLSGEAARLREALLEAYARTALHYAENGYEAREEDHALVADAVLAASEQDGTVFARLVTAMKGRSPATAALLEAVCTIATYDEKRRQQLRWLWPGIMGTALGMAETTVEPFYRGRVAAALIPAPRPVSSDPDLRETFAKARKGWVSVRDLAPLIDQWLAVAHGDSAPIARLAMLLLSSPLDQQVSLGLPWIRRLVVPDHGAPVIEALVLMDWLTMLHTSEALTGETRRDYDVIIDTLAADGVAWARELQRRDT